MANNRMWLLHRPSGLAFFLGKNLGEGWYVSKPLPDINDFYDAVERWVNESGEWTHEDFCLAMEDCSGAKMAFADWQYGKRFEHGKFWIMEVMKK